MVATERIRMLPDREQTLPMTYQEWRDRVDEGAHSEWADGEAIVFMPPKEKHQALLDFLIRLIGDFAELFGLGIVRMAPYEMRAIPGGPAREPDLLFIARAHLDRVTANGLLGSADLVVEIVSAESARRDRVIKFAEYEKAGVPEYWLIDPRPAFERADFYQRDAHGRFVPVAPDPSGRYRSAILPGFWLDPAWFWQDPLPGALAALLQIAPDALRRLGPPAP